MLYTEDFTMRYYVGFSQIGSQIVMKRTCYLCGIYYSRVHGLAVQIMNTSGYNNNVRDYSVYRRLVFNVLKVNNVNESE